MRLDPFLSLDWPIVLLRQLTPQNAKKTCKNFLLKILTFSRSSCLTAISSFPNFASAVSMSPIFFCLKLPRQEQRGFSSNLSPPTPSLLQGLGIWLRECERDFSK